MTNRRPFLTAGWHYLAMLNYEVPPAALARYVPRGTELDAWNGKTYLSLVGLLFRDTRVLGLGIPWHRHFPEVNLRCYVRYRSAEGWRRGVVFIKELVPKAAVALVARLIYNENYVSLPLRLAIERAGGRAAGLATPSMPCKLAYTWRWRNSACCLQAEAAGEPGTAAPGSEEEFITEHYWGYAAQRGGGTLEYQVEHPRWQVWRAPGASFAGDAAGLYGPAFAEVLAAAPGSAFIADGSPVTVYQGARIA